MFFYFSESFIDSARGEITMYTLHNIKIQIKEFYSMVTYLSRREERKLIISNYYESPDPQYARNSFLLQECRKLGSEYCKKFNDNGYDDKFNHMDTDKVVSEIVEIADENEFLSIFKDHEENTRFYRDFFGKCYTISYKDGLLKNASFWDDKRKEIEKFLSKYPGDAKIVLATIHDINVQNGVKYKNFYMVKTEAENKGFSGKNWMKILSELQLIKIIPAGDYKDLHIYDELVPLVEEVLGV